MRLREKIMDDIAAKYSIMINRLPMAARAFILLFGSLLVFWLWRYFVWQSISAEKIKATSRGQTANLEVKVLETQLKNLKETLNVKKAGANAAPEAAQNQVQLISPNDMREVLHNMLTNKYRLSILQFQNLPVKILLAPQQNFKLYEYGMILKFQGDYFTTIKYLQEVESLRWRLFWDKLEYKVTKYPVAEVTLQVHTISDQEGWVNV